MPAWVENERRRRGDLRLLAHCSAGAPGGGGRVPPVERLERAVGSRLARLLLVALAAQSGRRGSSSP